MHVAVADLPVLTGGRPVQAGRLTGLATCGMRAAG